MDKEETKLDQEPKIETSDNNSTQDDAAVIKKKSKKRKAKKTLEEQPKKKIVSKQSDPIAYLRLFQSDRNAWKFRTMDQIWLLKHIYDIDDNDFAILVEYVKGLKGGARDRTLKEAHGKIPAKTTDYDQDVFDAEAALASVEPQATSAAAASDNEDENDTVEIKRARAIVKALTC
ncbi:hypothetical protein BX666DRAFT_377186 [Dichotomocladium elegans]|nr:hypothetical protein BX666DRAFT_377186 [Dichotomocladium elegans]